MVRLIGITLFAFCVVFPFEVQPRPMPAGAELQERPAVATLQGSTVILSDGMTIGHVISAWSGGPRVMVLQIALDKGVGFNSGELTLTVPEPVDPRVPITLMLSRRALGDILANDAP